METRHAVQVDLPTPVYETALELATARGMSLAEFACEAITEKAQSPPSKDLAEAYEVLAEDSEETNVEVFLAAQSEAIAE